MDAIVINEKQLKTAYAAYSINRAERLDSSSGGIFSLLARDVLHNNGIVYGVTMSDDCRRAEYLRVTNLDDLKKLRGSKYLQAHVGGAFKQVKSDLENGQAVLFSGTGCQINGLKAFLSEGRISAESTIEQKYSNLYCVDVVCHGVPSPALWREYVDYVEQKYRSRLVSINFRCKNENWNNYGVLEIDDQERKFYIPKSRNPYMLMFLRDYCLRPACYECVVKEKKTSDLSLADFWGIEKIAREMTDGDGVSLVIIRTEKGKALLGRILADVILRKVDYADGVRYNPAESRSAKRPIERTVFYDDMRGMSFDELRLKYGMPKPVPLSKKLKSLIKKIMSIF